ncbi:NAD-dependent DNA ligase LigA [Mycoplasma procyoni]|uniref:NAD-dependent DNA ligase LigA n=1 Tax=Mycoplasma procyoni TaxID=568784 RepID=UPI00197B5959|nr:NAD-dependent DNA ligase LigA [Mycoplasma procyoni]MBN3535042.1 NAD-dependent DNA ligase LigA [Mycoplasma procyoni]
MSKLTEAQKEEIRKKIRDLRQLIHHHDHLYFDQDNPEITDGEYNELVKKLIKQEKEYYYLFSHEENMLSPTKIVKKNSTSNFVKVAHKYPMLSLNKAYSKEELEKFENDIKADLNQQTEFYVEPKIDGLSIALHYKNGKLVQALTRGDGKEGEDITENILKVDDQNLPKEIPYLKDIEIRGEIYLDKNTFKNLNTEITECQIELEKQKELKEKLNESLDPEDNKKARSIKLPKCLRSKTFLNPRNAAAGIVRRKNGEKAELSFIKVFLYQVMNPLEHEISSVDQTIKFLKDNKLPVNQSAQKVENILEAFEIIKDIENKRDDLNYEIDGVVIKVNNHKFFEQLGATSKYPKGAIAYKFYDEIAISVLKGVEYQVGRTGKIAYVAQLKPTLLNGTTVSKAYLHNYQNILELKIRIGEEVKIKKSGEIIPQVIESLKKFDSTNIVILEKCPSCQTPLVNTEKEQFCYNEDCVEKIKRRIEHFFSTDAVKVDTLSSKTVSHLYDNGFIKDIYDVFLLKDKMELFHLTNEKYKELKNTKNKNEKMNWKIMQVDSQTKLFNAIEGAKKTPLFKFIYGLGINNVGYRNAIHLAKKVKTIKELMDYDFQSLIEINDFGQTIVDEITKYFSDQKNRELLLKLDTLNFEFPEPFLNNQTQLSEKLKDISFVITGELSETRKHFQNLIEAHSGKLLGAVSSKVNYLVVGDDPGKSKIEKAQKLNIEIIDEKGLLKLIQK